MTPQQGPHVVAVGYERGDALSFECDVLALK
jgi:hypothetical protein